jgi:tetratricopeptide (TPR) repeat protein
VPARLQQLAAFVACLAVATPARGAPSVLQDPEARAHFEKAQQHFDAENYAAAVPELKAAYAIEPNPMLLYAWAQAERMGGDCARALVLYRRFLATDPPQRSADVARANVLDCEAQVGPQPPPPPPDPGDGAGDDRGSGDTDGRTGSTRPADRPWHRDPAAGTLLGLGAAATVAGGIAIGVGRGQLARSTEAPTEGDYFREVDRARQTNLVGWVVLSVGGALLVAGAVRLAVLGVRHKQRRSSARWDPGTRGAGLVFRF